MISQRDLNFSRDVHWIPGGIFVINANHQLDLPVRVGVPSLNSDVTISYHMPSNRCHARRFKQLKCGVHPRLWVNIGIGEYATPMDVNVNSHRRFFPPVNLATDS